MISVRLAALLAFAAFARSAVLDVWAPPITYPNANSVWYAGFEEAVYWDASNPPASITNPVGKIYLVAGGSIDLDQPLASGFQLTDGVVQVQVPSNVATGVYQIVLFGDSGNDSPEFFIYGD